VLVISFVTWAFGSGEEPGGAEDAPPRQGIRLPCEAIRFSISVAASAPGGGSAARQNSR